MAEISASDGECSAGQASPPDSGCRLREPELPEDHLRGGPAASPVGKQGSETKVPGFLYRRGQKRSNVLVEALARRSAEQEHAFALVVVVDGDPGLRGGLVGRRGEKDRPSCLDVARFAPPQGGDLRSRRISRFARAHRSKRAVASRQQQRPRLAATTAPDESGIL
jgi:hypothetical protein